MNLYDKLKPEVKDILIKLDTQTSDLIKDVLKRNIYVTEIKFFDIWNVYRHLIEDTNNINVSKLYSLFIED